MWEVDLELISEWLEGLDDNSYDRVIAAMELLRRRGPALGRPLVDQVEGSRYPNMKELRPGSSGRQKIRILFAFDSKRKAIMLIAGDKSNKWSAWYKKNVPLADQLYQAYQSKDTGDENATEH